MTILKDLAVVIDTYTDRNGAEKKKWLTIGQLHASKEGREYITLEPHINLAAIPRKDGDSRVYVSMFEPKQKDGAPAAAPAQSARPAPAAGMDDSDVPFMQPFHAGLWRSV
jgi:hypothetical protein